MDLVAVAGPWSPSEASQVTYTNSHPARRLPHAFAGTSLPAVLRFLLPTPAFRLQSLLLHLATLAAATLGPGCHSNRTPHNFSPLNRLDRRSRDPGSRSRTLDRAGDTPRPPSRTRRSHQNSHQGQTQKRHPRHRTSRPERSPAPLERATGSGRSRERAASDTARQDCVPSPATRPGSPSSWLHPQTMFPRCRRSKIARAALTEPSSIPSGPSL